jgi:hypothetical protein
LSEKKSGGISFTPFLRKGFAKPKSNISFLVISQKRAPGSKRHRNKKFEARNPKESQMIEIGKSPNKDIRIGVLNFD